MSTTKTAAHRHQRSPHGEHKPKPVSAPIPDRTVYFLAILIGGFGVVIACLLTSERYMLHLAFGYIALVLYTINLEGWMAYRAKPRSDWRRVLAKLPLMPVGFGTKGGKPLDAAHGQPAVRKALIVFGLISVVLIAIMVYVLVLLSRGP